MPSALYYISLILMCTFGAGAERFRSRPSSGSLLARSVLTNTSDLDLGPQVQANTSKLPAEDLVYTNAGGVAVSAPFTAQRIGNNGPLLLQDSNLIEQLATFNRERIPERVVHAKGTGAHGYFEVTTNNGANRSMAGFLQGIGKKTPLTIRFSTNAGQSGSSDNVRDFRGVAIKLRTPEGIQDMLSLSLPVFWLKNPAKFPSLIRSQKRDPRTNLMNLDNFFDFTSQHPETVNALVWAYTDLGTPCGYRHMNISMVNTYRLVKSTDEWYYARFTMVPDQGIKNFTAAEAAEMNKVNPDFATQDLHDAIEQGDFPSWTVYIQTLTPQEALNQTFDVLDPTVQMPLTLNVEEIGKIYLTQNPTNYFAEVEQAAFSPSNMVPGFEPSADPILQARMFAYPDAQRHRLGPNFKQLPINVPINSVANFERDGRGALYNNQGGRPNFQSSQDPIKFATAPYDITNQTIFSGGVLAFTSEVVPNGTFTSAAGFINHQSSGDQANFISNLAADLAKVTDQAIVLRQLNVLAFVNATMTNAIAAALNITIQCTPQGCP